MAPQATAVPSTTATAEPALPTMSTTAPTPLPTPTPDLVLEEAPFDLVNCAMTRAAQVPIEFEYLGTVPTGFDGINQANCTFGKEVESVTVVLTGPASHSETFTLDPPTAEVSFPLPEGTLSVTTLEIVPPGEYLREMTVASITGETLIISHQEGVLRTVMILEPAN